MKWNKANLKTSISVNNVSGSCMKVTDIRLCCIFSGFPTLACLKSWKKRAFSHFEKWKKRFVKSSKYTANFTAAINHKLFLCQEWSRNKFTVKTRHFKLLEIPCFLLWWFHTLRRNLPEKKNEKLLQNTRYELEFEESFSP